MAAAAIDEPISAELLNQAFEGDAGAADEEAPPTGAAMETKTEIVPVRSVSESPAAVDSKLEPDTANQDPASAERAMMAKALNGNAAVQAGGLLQIAKQNLSPAARSANGKSPTTQRTLDEIKKQAVTRSGNDPLASPQPSKKPAVALIPTPPPAAKKPAVQALIKKPAAKAAPSIIKKKPSAAAAAKKFIASEVEVEGDDASADENEDQQEAEAEEELKNSGFVVKKGDIDDDDENKEDEDEDEEDAAADDDEEDDDDEKDAADDDDDNNEDEDDERDYAPKNDGTELVDIEPKRAVHRSTKTAAMQAINSNIASGRKLTTPQTLQEMSRFGSSIVDNNGREVDVPQIDNAISEAYKRDMAQFELLRTELVRMLLAIMSADRATALKKCVLHTGLQKAYKAQSAAIDQQQQATGATPTPPPQPASAKLSTAENNAVKAYLICACPIGADEMEMFKTEFEYGTKKSAPFGTTVEAVRYANYLMNEQAFPAALLQLVVTSYSLAIAPMTSNLNPPVPLVCAVTRQPLRLQDAYLLIQRNVAEAEDSGETRPWLHNITYQPIVITGYDGAGTAQLMIVSKKVAEVLSVLQTVSHMRTVIEEDLIRWLYHQKRYIVCRDTAERPEEGLWLDPCVTLYTCDPLIDSDADREQLLAEYIRVLSPWPVYYQAREFLKRAAAEVMKDYVAPDQ